MRPGEYHVLCLHCNMDHLSPSPNCPLCGMLAVVLYRAPDGADIGNAILREAEDNYMGHK